MFLLKHNNGTWKLPNHKYCKHHYKHPLSAPYRYPIKVGDTRDIAEPTYKTFNLFTRLLTYLQDFQLTYKTQIQPQTILSTNLQDFQLSYKTFNLPTRNKTARKLDFQQTYKTLNRLMRH